MSLPPADRRKSYVRIADELREDIRTGRLAVGDTLPSVADLADRFGRSKMTVGNAIALLREEGLVQTAQGSRTVVIEAPTGAQAGDEPQRSEEFQIIAEQLKDMRAAIRQLGARLDDLDERTQDLSEP